MNGRNGGRKPDGKFAPGNIAATGRKSGLRQVRELFRKDAPKAEKLLRAMVENDAGKLPEGFENTSTLIFEAAKLVLAYAYGRPVQANVLALSDSEVSDELRASVCASVARFAAQCEALGGRP